jgi:hypothetical protein
MTKIIAATLALSLLSVPYVVAQTSPAPTTQEECEKVDGMKWDADAKQCVSK